MVGQNKRNLFNLFYETENDLLEREAVQVWFTQLVSFVYSLSSRDDNQSYVNQRLIESESCDTWNSLYTRKTFHLQLSQLS